MIIFWGMCIVLSIWILYTNRAKKSFLILVMLFFAYLAMSRDNSIPDTSAYIFYYNYLSSIPFNLNNSSFEYGFQLLIFICGNLLNLKVNYFFLIIVLINLILVYKSIKNSVKYSFETLVNRKYLMPYIFVSFLMYISYYGFYYNFIVLRMGLASAAVILSWTYWEQNKLKSIILYGVALFFHTSAIFAIFGFFFLIKKTVIKKKMKFIWLILIGGIYLSRVSVLLLKVIPIFAKIFLNNLGYYSYMNQMLNGDNSISLRFVFNYILLIVFFEKINSNIFFEKILNIYMFGMSLIAILWPIIWIERITDFYVSIGYLLMLQVLGEINYKHNRILLITLVLFCNFIFIYRIMY